MWVFGWYPSLSLLLQAFYFPLVSLDSLLQWWKWACWSLSWFGWVQYAALHSHLFKDFTCNFFTWPQSKAMVTLSVQNSCELQSNLLAQQHLHSFTFSTLVHECLQVGSHPSSLGPRGLGSWGFSQGCRCFTVPLIKSCPALWPHCPTSHAFRAGIWSEIRQEGKEARPSPPFLHCLLKLKTGIGTRWKIFK